MGRLGAGLVAGLLASQPALAQDSALLRLLTVLRDKGTLSSQEFEALRAAMTPAAPASAPSVTPPAGPAAAAATVETRLAKQEKDLADLRKRTDGTAPALVSEALANKWYERIRLRGYTQFRYSEVLSTNGAQVEVPADRSVNENETFGIRRGRFIFSGDLSRHLFLYAQSDFNGSVGGSGDYGLQMRDLYADISLNKSKSFRIRAGQSKVPFGFVNLQSSQNRLTLERADALNSAAEGERDLGVYAIWASPVARQRFKDLVDKGLKGSGDYGVVAVGAYSGQGLNRPDLNGQPHVLGRVSYPFAMKSGQMFEVGAQAYHGRFVPTTQAIAGGGGSVVPAFTMPGLLDQRVAGTFVWYPQPIGLEAEWNLGRGPALDDTQRTLGTKGLNGGYVLASYRHVGRSVSMPFLRWNYFDGNRKFGRNAPRNRVNEIDFGLEWTPWSEVELTAIYTRTIRRTRASAFPLVDATGANRLGFQVQWNY